jgi:hypothetical protein
MYGFAGGCNGGDTVDEVEEGLFPASEATPGQAQSRRAYYDLLARLKTFAWWEDFEELVGRGWDWRKAVYIAWATVPAARRQPETQAELATQVLGMKSDRVISRWRKQQPEIDVEIARMQAAPLLRHRRAIYDALVAVAVDPDPKAHQDRKLALEMLGDYRPRSQAEVAVTEVDAGVVIYLPENGRDGEAGESAGRAAGDVPV